MLGFISTSDLNTKANELIEAFESQVTFDGRLGKKKSNVEQLAKGALDQLFLSATEFCRNRRLGVIGRARFAKALQRELYRRGYASEIVSKVTTAVTLNALIAPRNTE